MSKRYTNEISRTATKAKKSLHIPVDVTLAWEQLQETLSDRQPSKNSAIVAAVPLGEVEGGDILMGLLYEGFAAWPWHTDKTLAPKVYAAITGHGKRDAPLFGLPPFVAGPRTTPLLFLLLDPSLDRGSWAVQYAPNPLRFYISWSQYPSQPAKSHDFAYSSVGAQ